MNVTLGPDDEKLIAEKLGGQGFATPEDVVTHALRLMASHERTPSGLREDIERGYQQSLRGEGVDGELFMDQLEAEINGPIVT